MKLYPRLNLLKKIRNHYMSLDMNSKGIDLFFNEKIQSALSPADIAELVCLLDEDSDIAEEKLYMSDFYDDLFRLFSDIMPYGTAKARTGDPIHWIAERLK
jgi:hypothetical protein